MSSAQINCLLKSSLYWTCLLLHFCPFFRYFSHFGLTIEETDKLIDANINNQAALAQLFQALFLLTKIFHSLNSQDLPEFFEDHQEECMVLFQKYLEYKNPLLETVFCFFI